MKSWLRAIVAFLYTVIVCGLFLTVSTFVLPKLISRTEGFWMVVTAAFGILIFFGWLSERGVEYASIPYNYLWDRTRKTRVATSIAALLLWVYGLIWPFLIPIDYTFGDWVIVAIWEICSFFFFYNMISLPFINHQMGVNITAEQENVNCKVGWMKRLILSIPFFRHKMAENTVTSSDGDAISICNKMLSMKVAPMLVEEINTGKMGIDVLSSKEYFRNLLSYLFGKNSEVFINNLNIERRDLDVNPDISVWLMETPSTGSVGQSAFIGFVYTKQKGVSAYTWEHSINGSRAVCEWYDKTHYYYRNAENISQFVNEIIALKKED